MQAAWSFAFCWLVAAKEYSEWLDLLALLCLYQDSRS
jgi:hypothetical protein